MELTVILRVQVDLTFDVAGNINLDAGGANINLYDDGTTFCGFAK